MAKKYLDYDGLLYFWQKIKAAFVADIGFNSSTNYITKTKNGNTSNVVQLPSGVSPSTTTPKMDGTAATGSETAFARGDHVHPTDTSRAASSHSHGHITSSGTLQVNPVDIGEGDQLVIVDGSNQDKVAKSSVTFDGSTTTQALTKKGTWETFSTDGEPNVLEGVQMNGTDLAITNKKVNIPTFGTRPAAGESGSLGLVPAPTRQAFNLTQVLTDTMGWAEVNLFTEVKNSGTDIGKRAMVLQMYSPNGNSAISAIIPDATTSETGLMSSTDKTKLDSIAMSNGKIDASILPSYVDDVIEAYARSGQTALSQNWLATGSATGTVITPETGKIYVLMADSGDYAANTQFRWGGTAYVKLSDGGVSSITNAEIDTIVAA